MPVKLTDLEQLAREAGAIIAKARVTGPSGITEKGLNDFVTHTDRECEALIHETLKRIYPSIPLLAEEGTGDGHGREEEAFCVDPLDGTNNFVHGIPVCCVSIGYLRHGKSTAGVVFDPVHRELFSAEEGHGATMNGLAIRASARPSVKGAFVATGFPFKELARVDAYLDGFRRILAVTGGVRRCGSAALDMCWTAAGRFDGFWELGLKPWDMAAGTIILREAGGSVSDLEGGESFLFGGDVVSGASAAMQEELRRLVVGGAGTKG